MPDGDSENVSMLTLIQEETLPQALMIGVDYNMFWSLNPKTLSPFIKAFQMKQKQLDFIAWQQGMYIRVAMASILDNNVKYPDRPTTYKKKDESIDNSEYIKIRMMERMIDVNKKFKG